MTNLEILKVRYACKAMNGKKVDEEIIDRILEAIRLAPTSSGLQPFEVMVITDQEIKEKIRKVAWNQSPVTDSSHLLVFAAWDNYTPERINKVFDLTNEIRGIKEDSWEAYRQQLLGLYSTQTEDQNFQHAAKQTYLPLLTAMMQAMEEGVDSTPMEGFEPNAVDEILGLKEKGLRSTLLLPLGYRDVAKDWLVNLVKVRKPKEALFTRID